MDATALVFYAVICGVLSWAAPNIGSPASRLLVGAGVGVVAASVLPMIKAVLAG